MSQKDLWALVGRASVDLEFLKQLEADFEKVAKESKYDLTPDEVILGKQALPKMNSNPPMPPMFPQMPVADIEFERTMNRRRQESQFTRMQDLGATTLEILKSTLENARKTYARITLMNTIMFGVGISLFVFAALYAAFAKDQKIYSLLFAGLGAANFIALFVMKPIESTQCALSNLVQVEIAFMNYWEQITFWEAFGLSPQVGPPEFSKMEAASVSLQRRSEETITLLQKFIEDKRESEKDGAQ